MDMAQAPILSMLMQAIYRFSNAEALISAITDHVVDQVVTVSD